MCRGPKDVGGPRRCSCDCRAAYQRANGVVTELERTEQEALEYLRSLIAQDSPSDATQFSDQEVDEHLQAFLAEDSAAGTSDVQAPPPVRQVSFGDKETRVEDIRREIDTAMENLNTGDAWQQWLDHANQFHHYSLNNQLLIYMQREDATQVAGFNKWKELGRSVNKGEKAIWIQAPMVVRRKKTDSPDEEETRVIGFKPVPVYDVAQTSGKELPAAPLVIQHEHGEAPEGMVDDLRTQVEAHGYRVVYEDLGADPKAKNGRAAPDSKTVAINSNRSPAQRALTLAHELAHIELGHTERMHEYHHGGQRPTMEVEAESVAYVIARRYGYQPSKPFTYIDGWAKGNPALVKSTATSVCAASQRILSKILSTKTASAK